MNATYERIYGVVNRIPKGRVATYGQVAGLAGIPGQARRVGYALSALGEGRRVAWHRVVNARGEISPRSELAFAKLQRAMLEAEGVAFGRDGRIAFSRFAWQPRAPAEARTAARARRTRGGRRRGRRSRGRGSEGVPPPRHAPSSSFLAFVPPGRREALLPVRRKHAW